MWITRYSLSSYAILNFTDWTNEEKTHLGEELSDVLIYLLRLADMCEIDLPAAAERVRVCLNSGFNLSTEDTAQYREVSSR